VLKKVNWIGQTANDNCYNTKSSGCDSTFSLSLSLSLLIYLTKVCTFNISFYDKSWGCEYFCGCLVSFVTCCVWWRMKVAWLTKGHAYCSLVQLTADQWYKHNEIASFTITYLFICIQPGIFPIPVVGHLQTLFWLCRLCAVQCFAVDRPSWQFKRGVSAAEQCGVSCEIS
jgi:hypothetical protein